MAKKTSKYSAHPITKHTWEEVCRQLHDLGAELEHVAPRQKLVDVLFLALCAHAVKTKSLEKR
jgi:hypothetical protein